MLDSKSAREFVLTLYKAILRREPAAQEFDHWVTRATTDLSPSAMVTAFFASAEGKQKTPVQSAFPSGHFYSPVVDPRTVSDYFAAQHLMTYKDFHGIDIDVDNIHNFWKKNLPTILAPFSEEPDPQHRFYLNGAPFPFGDAAILRTMISVHRPKRIIEIGSGFSTACMLDSADRFGLRDLKLTCIDPDANRLRKLLRAGDERRIQLHEKPVQEIPLDIFRELEANDILFIDSTHILKTGSDVHYELFSILPALKAGVVVHFHDTPYPFEYSRKWVFDLNYSWNEVYAVRAFLMYNSSFKVYFWNSLMRFVFPDEVKNASQEFYTSPGSSMWVIKTA